MRFKIPANLPLFRDPGEHCVWYVGFSVSGQFSWRTG